MLEFVMFGSFEVHSYILCDHIMLVMCSFILVSASIYTSYQKGSANWGNYLKNPNNTN